MRRLRTKSRLQIVKAVGSIDALSEKLEECSAKIDWVRAEQVPHLADDGVVC